MYFSEEEWSQLDPDQKALRSEVMLENHRNMFFLIKKIIDQISSLGREKESTIWPCTLRKKRVNVTLLTCFLCHFLSVYFPFLLELICGGTLRKEGACFKIVSVVTGLC
uniref:KRAB domain-containing protein n=1 Tax=Laticauda laticaudata TaxID=8630 RepID=A0A8C5RFB4_LATLA